jgi:DNA invertase Pin-like site-specific DNA recombinase
MPKASPIRAYPIRAYSYIRFSTPRQAEGGSLERQTRLTDEYCKRRGLILDDSLKLNDLGVSAFRGDNVREGALAGFLAACRMGRVPKGSFLIIESLDRLSRDQIRPALQLFLSLQDFGIVIVTLQPEREYLPDGADALSLIEPLIVFARSHEESLMKSHRRKEAWKVAHSKALQGKGPMTVTCPAWLEVTSEGFRIKEEAASTVRKIFALACDGLGVHRITKLLNQTGVPPIGDGKRWVQAYVYRILSRPAVIGSLQTSSFEGKNRIADGQLIPDFYPPVVSQEDWAKAQAALQRRGNGGGAGRKGCKGSEETNLFTGLLTDALTGDKLQIVNTLGRRYGNDEPKRYRYLCRSVQSGDTVGPRIDYGVFEEAVLHWFYELKPADLADHEKAGNGRQAEIARLSGLVLDLDSRLERTRQKALEAEDFDSFLDLIQDLQAKRKQTLKQREELERIEDGHIPAQLGEAQTLIGMLKATSGPACSELRRRIKEQIRRLVDSAMVLILRRGKTCICAVQFTFSGGNRRRNYLILHKPGTRYGGGYRKDESYPSKVFPGTLDLRSKRHLKELTETLTAIDIGELAKKMRSR